MRKPTYRLLLVIFCQTALTVSCSVLASKPSDIAKSFINDWAERNVDAAAGLLSSTTINSAGGIAGAKAALSSDLFYSKKMPKVEILSMSITREDIAGTLAEVDAKVEASGDDHSQTPATKERFTVTFKFKFVEENKEWKISRATGEFGQSQSSNSSKAQSKGTPTQTPPSLDDEALAAVKDLWEQHTTKCGDSYFSSKDFRGIITLHQYKDVSFVARRTGPTSEADRLNGILWNGEVQIRTSVYRERVNGGEWSEWKEDRTMSQGWYNVGATKRASGWSVVQLLAITDQRKIECSAVPR